MSLEQQPAPYTLDYVASHYRNYVIFGAIIALGLDLFQAEIGAGNTVSGLDYDALPGIPQDFALSIIGWAFLSLGLVLCVWNAFIAIRDMANWRKRSHREKHPVFVLKKATIIAALLLGILIPYGFAMMVMWSFNSAFLN
ncbi:hypothetical protein [Aliihoeflea sp. PC F10.4]